MKTDVLIVGGGCGGVAAALAVTRAGRTCIIAEPTRWLGGQLTSQAVPPDEHRWIEEPWGCNRSYGDFRRRVRDWYRQYGNLTQDAARQDRLNPGDGWVSRLCFDPRVGVAVIDDLLAPHVAAGRIHLLYQARPVAADVDGKCVKAMTFEVADTTTTIEASYFLDASDFGDVYPLVGCDFMLGAEASDVFGELHGRDDLENATDSTDQQALTWCFAIEHRPGEDHTINRPDQYANWRDFVPALTPPWPGRLFSWQIDDADDPKTLAMIPPPDGPEGDELELWRYRRIVAAHHHTGGRDDVCLWNTVQTDYFRQPAVLPGDDPYAGRDACMAATRQMSRCFLYWLQTEAPRHDDGHGHPGLRLCGEPLGTDDGLAMACYVREGRRLAAETVVTEAHVGVEQRGDTRGHVFADAVAIGHYMIDLHPTAAGRNSVYVEAAPYTIPLRSLLPRDGGAGSANVLAAGKSLGVSHVANGCTRLHPTEWAVGEAAGALAAWCLEHDRTPHGVSGSRSDFAAFRDQLVQAGAAVSWPDDLS
jgi:hypothetical protein